MSEHIVGYTSRRVTQTCENCKETSKQRIVLKQRQIRIPSIISIMGLDERSLAYKCPNCSYFKELSDREKNRLKNISYYKSPVDTGSDARVGQTKAISFEVLNNPTKRMITEDNRKKALRAGLVWLLLAIIVFFFSTGWGLIFFGLAIFSTLYLYFEDPYKVYEASIKRHGKLKLN